MVHINYILVLVLVLVLAGSAKQTDSSSDPALIQQLIDQGWIGAGEADGERVWCELVSVMLFTCCLSHTLLPGRLHG